MTVLLLATTSIKLENDVKIINDFCLVVLQVKIVLQESRLHASTLKLELVNNRPHLATFSTDAKGQKAEIIKVLNIKLYSWSYTL